MPRGPSFTAEVVALMRALEGARPSGERVLDDPFAARFLGPWLRPWLVPPTPRLLAALDGPSGLARGELGPTWPELWALPLAPLQMLHYVVARHRYLDDVVVDALAAGAEQVVVLGAGYDTRAWRLSAALAGRPLWELDFPPTQARKRRLLGAAAPALDPGAARFVAVDFARESFGERLVAAGFPIGARTVWVWEGVSMYLTPEAVARTLETLRQLGGAGSVLAADLWCEPRGHALWQRAHRLGAHLFGAVGEPLRFQLAPEAASAYFDRHGFTVAEHLAGGALSARVGMHRRPLFAPLYVLRAEQRPDNRGWLRAAGGVASAHDESS